MKITGRKIPQGKNLSQAKLSEDGEFPITGGLQIVAGRPHLEGQLHRECKHWMEGSDKIILRALPDICKTQS